MGVVHQLFIPERWLSEWANIGIARVAEGPFGPNREVIPVLFTHSFRVSEDRQRRVQALRSQVEIPENRDRVIDYLVRRAATMGERAN